MTSLRNKTLVVTGASMGIGEALALELAKEGVNLVLGARTEDKLRSTRNRCRGLGVKAECLAGDVSSSNVAQELVQAAFELGNFHGFIHAAGVLAPGPTVWELNKTRFREVLEASLCAGHQLIRHAVPLLIKQGHGLTVFFGSGAAERAQPGIGAYCVAKAAEEHLARQLAAEAPEITTIIWRPGVVRTRMQTDARKAEGGGAQQLKEVFEQWDNDGLLITPGQSARGLVDFLLGEPERYHGQVADIRKVGNPG
ncbi:MULTISPECIES: SDR family NAD(P)-dependent oxidoreductase [unclassified Pseudodesulfovibrio]|uniref:SDR family NAD(P)-dependent oxidoreductase n=1 Tax=unclassified Pseudodesulfovibrio TaxID=2661612 RepID=UPI000FEBC08D|nr:MULTISPECIES: SDR family NAD(P)-dependent oxidoreductase [unclassified Pseudodesulfovibrio]MCJ2166156.1 SDR family NAD(P)-dependent oxidoreductase [Pseudodesulfovibrio sp. S3-i]RWU02388.1 SDR family NAD(P)-dependent oxidoreductase [Pseudodesulfovibrio sp. S3]